MVELSGISSWIKSIGIGTSWVKSIGIKVKLIQVIGSRSSWYKSLDQGQVVQVIGIQIKFIFEESSFSSSNLSYQVQVNFSFQELQVSVGCRVFLPSSLLGDQQLIQSFKLYAVIEQ